MDMPIIAGAILRRKRNLLLTTNSMSSTWEMNSALFNHDVDYQYIDNTDGRILYSGSAADLGFPVDLSISNGDTSLFILDRASGFDIDELYVRLLVIDIININFLPSLLRVDFRSNNVSKLDVTQNTSLTALTFRQNNVLELDVTQNTALTDLAITANSISVLDLSQNTALTSLIASGNTLTSLNVKNGNNKNVLNFDIRNNADLDCAIVDNIAYANTNFTNKDSHTVYSETICP
jgi:hypothetical protein